MDRVTSPGVAPLRSLLFVTEILCAVGSAVALFLFDYEFVGIALALAVLLSHLATTRLSDKTVSSNRLEAVENSQVDRRHGQDSRDRRG